MLPKPRLGGQPDAPAVNAFHLDARAPVQGGAVDGRADGSTGAPAHCYQHSAPVPPAASTRNSAGTGISTAISFIRSSHSHSSTRVEGRAAGDRFICERLPAGAAHDSRRLPAGQTSCRVVQRQQDPDRQRVFGGGVAARDQHCEPHHQRGVCAPAVASQQALRAGVPRLSRARAPIPPQRVLRRHWAGLVSALAGAARPYSQELPPLRRRGNAAAGKDAVRG
mmetsp:Transcript_319/g.697  ORF Transcript_319/g.697 Transcript_319/m.697 type:complete len:223 (+) Transcript_319:2051-2719(+)